VGGRKGVYWGGDGRGIATSRPLTGTPRYIRYLQVDSAVSAATSGHSIVFARVSSSRAVYTHRYILFIILVTI